MKSSRSKKILQYYDELFEQYGYSPQSVGWGNREGRQGLRFDVLCQIGDLKNSSVLDLGCGFGDLYGYLKHKKIPINYLGVDINPNLINIGKKIYPYAKFQVRDIEIKKFKQKFDWIIASGITSNSSTFSDIKKLLSEMFHICKKGVAINFVSDLVDYKKKSLCYFSPEKILLISKGLSNRFYLRHDYMPFEFTLYLYKNNKKTKNLVFQDVVYNKSDNSWKKS